MNSDNDIWLNNLFNHMQLENWLYLWIDSPIGTQAYYQFYLYVQNLFLFT